MLSVYFLLGFLTAFIVPFGSSVWYPRQLARLALYTSNTQNVPRSLEETNVMIGYMNTQQTNQNACQMATNNIPNQIAIGSNMFHTSMCGQEAKVLVGGKTLQGIVIDTLDDRNRVMVSPNLFEQVAGLDIGIVSGTICIPNANEDASDNPQKGTLASPISSPISVLGKMTEAASGLIPSSSSSAGQEMIQIPEKGMIGQIPINEQNRQNMIDPAPKDINQGYQHVLYDSSSYGKGLTFDSTFYYDSKGEAGKCGPANAISFFPESRGIPECSSWVTPETLLQIGSDNVVAIPHSLLGADRHKYCGKRIVVTVNGHERTDLNLFVFDGCAACDSNGGLDFSSNMFADLFSPERCKEGRIKNEITWKIVDESLKEFIP